MASKTKANGCTSCRRIIDAARGDLERFFEKAALAAGIQEVKPLADIEPSEEAKKEAAKFVNGEVAKFRKFCEARLGGYAIPGWLLAHAERTLGTSKCMSNRPFRQSDARIVRPSLRVAVR